jgi:tetratricopeptide (TPR) repeat protein
LYCYYYSKSRKFIKEFAEQIVKLNDIENVLEDIPLAILLEICGNKCTFFSEYKKAKDYFLRCIAICNKTKNANHIQAICFSDFARLLSSEGNFDDAKQYLDEAMEFVQKLKKPWQLQLKESVFTKYYRCYNNHYVVYPQKLQYVINIAIGILKSFNANELYYRIGKYNGDHEISIFFMRRALSGLYNRIGEYNKACECEKEAKFFLKRIQAKGIPLVNHEVDLEICEGSTLLRMNRLSEAYDKLIKYIRLKKEMEENAFMYNVAIFISEILIRQNRLEEAYQYDKNALKMMENCSSNNDKKLSQSICYYHLALMEFKNRNLQQALYYLSPFFILMDDICKTIIKKEKYNDLKSKAAFDFFNDTEKIKHYFKNAAEIFAAVYGNSHPFVTDFVNKHGMAN